MNTWMTTGLVALAIIGSGSLAFAQPSSGPAETIEYRQQNFKQLGGAMRAIGQEAQSATPRFDVVRTNVTTMKALAAELPGWFAAGTGPEAGFPTKAKPEIWANRQGFDARVKELQKAVDALAAASSGSDAAAIGTSVKAIGAACQGCHTEFRAEVASRPS